MSDKDAYAEAMKQFGERVENTQRAMGQGPQVVVGLTARQQVWWEAYKVEFSRDTEQETCVVVGDEALSEFDKRFGGA